MAHHQKERMRKLELVATIIKGYRHQLGKEPESEKEIQDLYDLVMWNTGAKQETAAEYVRLVYKFNSLLSDPEP